MSDPDKARDDHWREAFAELMIFINRWQEKHDLRNSEVFRVMVDIMHKRLFPPHS